MDGLGDIYRSSYHGKLSEIGNLSMPWEDVVGQNIARNCHPRRIRNGILFLSASNPAWAQQIGFFKEDIKQKVNSYLAKNVVRDIRVEATGHQIFEREEKGPEAHLTAEDESSIESISSQVEDEELRKRIEGLMSAGKRLNMARQDEHENQ